ncbi:hypothetical protein FA15DRAFT_674136 [Coprinopsis marcescibilis]|uniref:Uncharacterized protein n=1 Tax=Coprinopsis marcescibilis TaxID=230819 RepID=A0A5C3KIU1_COPMA|nr:hypothetical protein FA15DRAFT_674136 [Coprinopsis marcescibilis]
MGLSSVQGDNSNDNIYRDFRRTVRHACIFFSIDSRVTYSKQDKETITKICKCVVKQVPYACKERFPDYWCTCVYLISFLHNQKHSPSTSNASSSDDEGEDEDEEEENTYSSDNNSAPHSTQAPAPSGSPSTTTTTTTPSGSSPSTTSPP